MFGCIYQLWDWLEAPPLFSAATMDAKKLQQLQQSQNVQKKIPLAYQTNIADYRTATHSPVFQQQHNSYHLPSHHLSSAGHYQQSPTTTSSSGPLSPIDIQPQANKLLLKHQLQNSGSGGSSAQSSPYHQASISSGYPTSSGGTGEQLYQSPPERTYLQAAGRLGIANNSALHQQYQQIQQAKLQALASQNEAIQQQQQRNFAMRQAMNAAAAPQGHYHMAQQQHQQQQQHRAPPSSLNLTNQFQPASGPLKVNQTGSQKSSQHYHQQQQEQIYVQHQQQQLQMQLQHQQQMHQQQQQQQQQQHHHHALQQRSKSDLQTPRSSDQSPIYIQQNHPGHVVNQAVQTQISTVAKSTTITKTPSSEDSSSASAKSPTHANLDRKKSTGGSTNNAQALKSPITKRPPNSPVTISGWLYKQGSDGLKVWRKRWFVLAEYCLYYYKSPDEDKVLGSILLPSYKVSACLPEDKIYRKFAFKCEHQNMRTYWLAAENAESMVQWVRALSAATLMQAPVRSGDSSEHPSGSSSVNHSGENSDSGINTLQSKMSGQGQVTPASDNGGGVTASSSNSGGGNGAGGGGAQPLYANAPPKPRRITDGGYSSPSPEHSVDNERTRSNPQASRRSGIMSPTLQQMQQQQYQQQQQQQHQQQQQQQQRSQHHAIYDTRTGNVSSAIRMPQQQSNYNLDNLDAQYQPQLPLSPEDYVPSPVGSPSQYMDVQMEQQIMQLQQQRMAVDDIYGERELYMQRLIQQRYPPNIAAAAYGAAAERRTPDAYGRSKNRLFSDYEDIYNLAVSENAQVALLQEASAYRRPMSPNYEDSKYLPAVPTRYTPNHLELSAAGSNINLRSRPSGALMRPHSADFLEYEARAEAASDAAAVAAATAMIKPDPVRAPRPKSSLDINRTPDSFYYSEENYAEKMRKSALYLQNPQAQPQQSASSYRIATGATTDFLSPVASGMNTIGYENPYERIYKRNELLQDALGNQAGHTSIPRMSRSQTMGNGAQIRSSSTHPHHPLSPTGTYQQQQERHSSLLSSGLTTQQIIQQNEQFLRSASARLPKRSSTFDDDVPSTSKTTTTTPNTTPTSPPTGTTASAAAASQVPPDAAAAHLEGERKREESMKRLLEWKQRMLQSPLTRKSAQHVSNSATAATQSGQTTSASNGNGNGKNNNNTTVIPSNITTMAKLGSNPNILLASTTVSSGSHHASLRGNNAGGGTTAAITNSVHSGIQRSRSETQANIGPTAAGYNSYSSDDEAGTITNAPAGRSSLRAITPSCSDNSNNNNNINNLNITTSNNTIAKFKVSKATGLISACGQETLENYTTAITTATTKTTTSDMSSFHGNVIKTTITINDMQQRQQQNQGPPLVELTNTLVETTPCTTDVKATQYITKSILKPILKTKIINVKPVSTLNDSQSLVDNDSLVRHSSLPKLSNTIALSDEKVSLNAEEPISPQISSYVPVYSTKTLTPSKSRTLSSGYEYIEIQRQDDSNKTDSIEAYSDNDEDSELRAQQIKTETEAIQDPEATPILMNLKRFKEREEQRQKFQLELENSEAQEDEDDIKTPTQDDAEQADNNKSQIMDQREEDDEEDTACEYTDDDLDEALAEEADDEGGLTLNISQDIEGEEEFSQIYENEPVTPQEHQASLDESHYLPMTPKKLDTDSETTNNASLISIMDCTYEDREEENHYVEMTKQLQEDDSKSNYEIMCIGQNSSNISILTTECGTKPKSLKTVNEPLYMELQAARAAKEEPLLPPSKTSTLKKNKKSGDTLKKKSKKSQQERSHQKRKDLPDILKPSQSSMVLNSDSSDADDESSKKLESKKMRSRSRFSLSDTFRPASYYLGASTPLNDCIESSDSEIVSPPPIPNSPPPMEELKTEEMFLAENYDTVKRRDSSGSKFNISYEQLPKIHASNTSLNIPKNDATLKSSRLSLPDHFRKVKSLKSPHLNLLKQHERTLSDSNYSFQTDNSSNTSSDFDLYNKLKQNSPSFVATPIRYQSNSSLTHNSKYALLGTGSNSESDTVELRHRQGSDSELDRQRSRRPLSEESISEIESLNEKFEDALETADLDTYLNNLQNSDMNLYQNTKFETSTSTLLTDAAAAQGAGILTNLIKPPKIFRNHDDEHFYGNIHFVSSTDSLQKLGGAEFKDLQMIAECSDLLGATSLTPTRYMTPLHSRNNSNISEQSAPYYYSELSSSRELLSTPTTLNNQRDIHAHGSNIDHIHNPIERAHIVNMELLADKDQAIDSKNLYKMKTNVEKLSYSTGKNLKAGEPFQHNSCTTQTFHLQQIQNPALKINNYQTKNAFPGIRAALTLTPTNSAMAMATPTITAPSSSSSNSQQVLTQTCQNMALTASCHSPSVQCFVATAGEVEPNAKNINVQIGSNCLVTRNPSPQIPLNAKKIRNNSAKSTVLGNPESGELLWEEDTLWRESLRRVSQRHARSLDDLDRIVVKPITNTQGVVSSAAVSAASGTEYTAVDSQHNRKPRLSRDVTYVNDNVSQHLRSSFKLRHDQTAADNQRTYDEVCPDNQSLLEDEPITTNEHDVYVQLTENNLANAADVSGELYEVLREETASNISSNKSAEIDRETIRQWDSMSSGLMKNSLLSTNSEQSPTGSNVKCIIDQLNGNCDNNSNPSVILDATK